MRKTATLPDPQVAMTLQELADIQAVAASHLTFSLTLACPLRCAHCIVNAAPDQHHTTMPLEVAQFYALQMPDLADYGIRSLSFTGGEPLLAWRQLKVLSDAASDVGMTCGVVTASHWARNTATARREVARYPGIQCWDLSVDAYHEEFVPLETVKRAYDALIEAGRRVTIRFSYTEPLSPDAQRILEFVTSLDEAEFACQRVRTVGRGTEVGVTLGQRYNPWVKPCLTQGMVVRYDGSISPCCLNLVEERRHPFQLGDARSRPLTEIHRDYLAMPLLQMIRVVGFSQLMTWLAEDGLDDRLPRPLPDDICDICELMMRDDTIAEYLTKRVAEPATQLKIAVLTLKTLNEPQMLGTVLQRFAESGTETPGLAEAAQLYEEMTA